jgi:hypothetical protein
MEGNMQRKLVLSLIACAGVSFASATVALADDLAPDTSTTTSTDTSSTSAPAPDPSDSGNGTGGGPGQNSGDSTQK